MKRITNGRCPTATIDLGELGEDLIPYGDDLILYDENGMIFAKITHKLYEYQIQPPTRSTLDVLGDDIKRIIAKLIAGMWAGFRLWGITADLTAYLLYTDPFHYTYHLHENQKLIRYPILYKFTKF